MPFVTTTEMLKKAQQGGYAVGAFNAENLEMVQAIIAAAEEENAPVMIQTTPGTLKYAGPACFAGIVSRRPLFRVCSPSGIETAIGAAQHIDIIFLFHASLFLAEKKRTKEPVPLVHFSVCPFALFCGGFRLLPFLDAAPGVHDQSQGDNAVGNEYAEILADGGVAEKVLPGGRRHNEQQVEQDTA